MNQKLRSLFAAELKELRKAGIAGAATEKYLLEKRNIKIPNIIYCVLQMLGNEYEEPNVMYIEYCGECTLCNGRSECQTFTIRERKIKWYFWYVNLKDVLNITDAPANSLGDSDCDYRVDKGEDIILFNLYAKLAYQCMAVYDTIYECYLPPAVSKTAKYVLFLFSHKAMYSALKTAIEHDDEETKYVIREVFDTIFELEEVKVCDIYHKLSHMKGDEKAAVGRVIASWGLGGDLQKRLKDVMDEFIRMLSHPRIRKLVKEDGIKLKRVLGERLFEKMKEYCQKNISIY